MKTKIACSLLLLACLCMGLVSCEEENSATVAEQLIGYWQQTTPMVMTEEEVEGGAYRYYEFAEGGSCSVTVSGTLVDGASIRGTYSLGDGNRLVMHWEANGDEPSEEVYRIVSIGGKAMTWEAEDGSMKRLQLLE